MKNSMSKIGLSLLFIPFFFFIYKIYLPRAAAFGCFDDCFNYGAGFFLNQGRVLFKDIFFNHQPLMAFISALIQKLSDPINIYDLLVKHRQVLLLWNALWAVIIFFRVGISGILFTFLYEGSKFYLFGDRFLAEGMIVYPFVYLLTTVFSIFEKKSISFLQYFIAILAGLFIFFAREPYILSLAIIALVIGLQVYKQKRLTWLLLPVILFFILLAYFPLSDYWNNLVTINRKTVLGESTLNLIQSFFYPLYIVVNKPQTLIHQILFFTSILFFFASGFFVLKKKYLRITSIVFLILGLANLRTIPVGQMYYSSFHLLPWYGMFLFITIFAVTRVSRFLTTAYIFIILFAYFSPKAFFYEHIDPQVELITNYGEEIKIGNAVKHLSNSTDTLFLDGWAELIYWQADRLSPYKYSWYTSVMPLIPEFVRAKEAMFQNSPPDF